jgi:hypothetical protein
MVVNGLEATRHLLDRQLEEVQQHLDGDGDLRVLLGDDTEELLDSSLLVNVIVAVPRQLLHQGVEAESEVIDVLTWLESQVLLVLT